MTEMMYNGNTMLKEECVEWTKARDNNGYGVTTVDRKTVRVHRLTWMSHHGSIPEGMVVRHKCDNPPCMNIAHLELGTQADNVADSVSRGRHKNRNTDKTHCDNGHEFNELNTYVSKDGFRFCRPCRNEAQKRYTKKKKEVG